MSPTTLRMAMLNLSSPPPCLLPRHPTWGRVFHARLAAASQSIRITSNDFDIKDDDYPSSLADFDAIILSGGAAEDAVYNDIPWNQKLETFIATTFAESPHVKIFGTCFGHGMVCRSLLGTYGVKVEPNPEGLEIGVKEIAFRPGFLDAFRKQNRRVDDGLQETMKVQLIHGDHVVVPEEAKLPEEWEVIGSTEQCKVQGIYLPGRVMTLQGHFEFDREINSEVIKHNFGASWEEEKLQEVLDDIDADDDANVAAGMILAFLLQSGPGGK